MTPAHDRPVSWFLGQRLCSCKPSPREGVSIGAMNENYFLGVHLEVDRNGLQSPIC